MRLFTMSAFVASSLAAGVAFAKLPPLSDEAKAKAAEAANKAAWAAKVGQYETCQVMDHVVATYRAGAAAAGKPASAAEPTSPCADPGPYVAQAPAAAKPIEASGAHSPPENATSPPSTNATSAQITGPRK